MSQLFKDAAEARKRADEAAWLAYLYADPICWGWPALADSGSLTSPQGGDITGDLSATTLNWVMDDPEFWAGRVLRRWQDGRCAICGHRRKLVEDHDHATGMVRGYLCNSCNIQEGVYREQGTLFGKYRERHPTKMLGLTIRYWDLIAKDFAQPASPRAKGDPWTDAASEDIGL
jgi:hypothetical protein